MVIGRIEQGGDRVGDGEQVTRRAARRATRARPAPMSPSASSERSIAVSCAQVAPRRRPSSADAGRVDAAGELRRHAARVRRTTSRPRRCRPSVVRAARRRSAAVDADAEHERVRRAAPGSSIGVVDDDPADVAARAPGRRATSSSRVAPRSSSTRPRLARGRGLVVHSDGREPQRTSQAGRRSIGAQRSERDPLRRGRDRVEDRPGSASTPEPGPVGHRRGGRRRARTAR